MNKIYDVIVIGGGIGGYYSAKTLRKAGKSVALIEKEILGGTSIRWGALPVKRVLDAFKEDKYRQAKEIREELILTLEDDLNQLSKKMEKDLLALGIDIYYGSGEFLNSKEYKINGKTLEAEYFIIATGMDADSTEDFQIDGEYIISHRKGIDLKNMPEKITILGGNVEGVEFAALYGEMGVETTIIEKEKALLLENDKDLVEPIENHLKSLGVRIIKGIGAKKAEIKENKVKVSLENGDIIWSQKAINTLSRKPNFPKGIENTKIEIHKEKILVNENLLTAEKNIFAIGDINGLLGMAHVAIQQALEVTDYILNKKPVNTNYEILPRAVFTLPEMAGVGEQEWELKQSNTPYKVGKSFFQNTWRGWSKKEEGFVKIILDKNNTILGIWMVGRDVSEYIGLLGMLVKEKKTVDDILSNLIIHPSLTEAILEAAIEGKNKK